MRFSISSLAEENKVVLAAPVGCSGRCLNFESIRLHCCHPQLAWRNFYIGINEMAANFRRILIVVQQFLFGYYSLQVGIK